MNAINKSDFAYISEMEDPKHLLDEDGIRDQLSKLLKDINKGFEDGIERADSIMDYWDLYYCRMNDKQAYSGESKIFIPFVHNAVNARKTRFVNQIFPQSKRHVECTSSDGTTPDAILSLAEHYITATKLRTQVMPALCVNGDVEGDYTIYLSWRSFEREIKRRVKMPVDPRTGEAKGEGKDEILLTEVVVDGTPEVEIIPDTDLCVLPATSDSIDQALQVGGSVSIVRRWTKTKVEALIDDGTIDEEAGEALLGKMESTRDKVGRRNTKKALTEGMGIKVSAKEVEVFEVWAKLKIKEPRTKTPGKKKRRPKRKLCQIFMRGDGEYLGCRENPYWNGKCPVLSVPVVKTAGSFKGEPRLKFCADMQYKANDAINIAMDSAMYSLLPIVMTDPEKNPRVASMILNMAAIWETSPNDTKFVEFPNLWEQGFSIAGQARDIIMQTLSVSPAAITQTGAKKKPTQAEMSNEQAVDLLTTADAVTVLEEGILTPIVQWFIDLDYQYRDRDLTIKKYGAMGLQAEMQTIEPLQMNERYEFRWLGVEAARNAQQIQTQISGMNVLRGIPPQLYQGYRLDLTPIIASLVENTFGPRLAPLIFESIQHQLSIPPEEENPLLLEGHDVPVSPLDNDVEHIQKHNAVMQGNPLGDPSGMMRTHIQKHTMALQQKQMAQMPQGAPGTPGGQPGQGMPGQPRPGAMPMRSPQGGQNPPGALPADQMNPQRAGRQARGNGA
jgi:hypothetical protein